MSRLTHLLRSVRTPSQDHSLPPLQRPGFPVAVCWSAKSGCTTILKWFLAHNGLLEEALAYSRWVHDYRHDKLFQATGYRRQCERLYAHRSRGTSILKVIRDPATRAVSSFLHFLRYGHDITSWPGAAALQQWKAAMGLRDQQGVSFRQFLLFVTAQQLRRSTLDIHFRPQYNARQDARLDTVIRLEDLSAGLRAVEDRHGLPHVDIGQLSRSGHHNSATAGHAWPTLASDVPADHTTVAELGTPPAQDFLDRDTLTLIRTAYQTDYEAYGRLYEPAPVTLQMQPATDRARTADRHGLRRRAA